MLILLLYLAATAFAAAWLIRYISCAALFWYLEQKRVPPPTEAEMAEGCRWAVKHLIKDWLPQKR